MARTRSTDDTKKARARADAEKVFEGKAAAPTPEAKARILPDFANILGVAPAQLAAHVKKIEEHKTALASQNALLRNAYKDAEKDGINLKVFKDMLKLRALDGATSELYLKQFTAMVSLQVDGAAKILQLIPDDPAQEKTPEQAQKDGRLAGLGGKGTQDCPYSAGSALGQAWLKGMHEGHAESGLKLAPGGEDGAKNAAWEAGAQAAREGKPKSACPFADDAFAFHAWVDGWASTKAAIEAPKKPRARKAKPAQLDLEAGAEAVH